ncbi:MAG: hypothetical protein EXQ50_08665 [Acidobacteria bacterium]|nr:hypothetical protein [Acidobacteriota bacterium]
MTRIYNEGLADRVGTFATRPRSDDDVSAWFDGVHPIVVVAAEGGHYRTRDCYAGIAEFSVDVSRDVVIVERVIPENLR